MTRKPTSRDHRQKITATDAKNRFGQIMKKIQNGPVFITDRGEPKAVVLTIGEYDDLKNDTRAEAEARVQELRKEFEKLHAQMQTPESRHAVDAALSASAEELTKVARRRKRHA